MTSDKVLFAYITVDTAENGVSGQVPQEGKNKVAWKFPGWSRDALRLETVRSQEIPHVRRRPEARARVGASDWRTDAPQHSY